MPRPDDSIFAFFFCSKSLSRKACLIFSQPLNPQANKGLSLDCHNVFHRFCGLLKKLFFGNLK